MNFTNSTAMTCIPRNSEGPEIEVSSISDYSLAKQQNANYIVPCGSLGQLHFGVGNRTSTNLFPDPLSVGPLPYRTSLCGPGFHRAPASSSLDKASRPSAGLGAFQQRSLGTGYRIHAKLAGAI